jgi:thiamine-monophosphate kinase
VPLPETSLIDRIRRMVGPNSTGIAGIGDDCAILRLPPGSELLVSTDLSLEGVHFRRDWHPPETIARRCFARGFSDIAAMGGAPLAFFLSVALPPELKQSWVDRFMRSLVATAGEYGASLAGGDTAQSPDSVLIDMTVLGSVPAGKAVRRNGARPGDGLFVTGDLGGSAAAIQFLRENRRKRPDPGTFPRHFLASPRLAAGLALRKRGLASAMIDTSDGLSTDLAHICEESKVGAEVWAEAVPRARVGKAMREVSLEVALNGGEDYELLFTSPRRVAGAIAGVRVTQIGRIVRGRVVVLKDAEGKSRKLRPGGWEHFR